MNIGNSFAVLKEITGFSDAELTFVLKYFKPGAFKKKQTILNTGKVADEVYFISEGCIRLFCEKDGAEITTYFFTENMFAGTYDSFISRRPTYVTMEAVENTQVLALSFTALEELYTVFPKMNIFVRKSIEQRFVLLHDLFTSYLLLTPEERYVKLTRERPELLNRIPQHQIASFIGVTSVSLSRIRNRLARKQH